jgi:hypothetical protein
LTRRVRCQEINQHLDTACRIYEIMQESVLQQVGSILLAGIDDRKRGQFITADCERLRENADVLPERDLIGI